MAGRRHELFGAAGAFCAGCGVEHEKAGMERVFIPARGYRYICASCLDKKSYFADNGKVRHQYETKARYHYGIELETGEGGCAIAVADIYGFVATQDSSIDGPEYKSPEYVNLHGFKALLWSLSEAGDLWDAATGHHVHISWPGCTPGGYMDVAEDLFGPLGEYLCNHAQECAETWGRSLNDGWANYSPRGGQDWGSKYSFINLLHRETVEFRLPKFTNATRYFWVVCLCREICDQMRAFDRGDLTATDAGKKILRVYRKYATGRANCQRPERNGRRNPVENR